MENIKVGELLTIRIKGKNKVSNSTKKMIEKYNIGNVILYSKNYDSYENMIKVINELKEINRNASKPPLTISIDQEGGRVDRFKDEIHNLRNMYGIASLKDEELLKETGDVLGELLQKTGINMDYAPVLDVKRFPDNHALGNRCFAENPEDAAKYAIHIMKGLQEHNVISVCKHFPGHGAAIADSHSKLPVIGKDKKKYEEEDTKAFKIANENGMDAVMVGHLMIPSFDNDYPASFSKKVIKDYLIDEIGFNGLIITDDLKMRSVLLNYNISNATIKALEAGSDIVMIGLPYFIVKRTIRKLNKKVSKSNEFKNTMENRIEKVENFKKKYKFTDEKIEGINVSEINQKIDKINKKISA